jgi:hypothetical protein
VRDGVRAVVEGLVRVGRGTVEGRRRDYEGKGRAGK